MEIKQENIIAAYNTADNNGKNLLRTMFPDVEFESDKQAKKRSITERIKTFEDACAELGEYHPCVAAWNEYKNTTMTCESNTEAADITAYVKLRVICAALNEGWKPQFIEDEYRWYPLFCQYKHEEIDKKGDGWKQECHLISTDGYETEYDCFAYAYSAYVPPHTNTSIGTRLCLKSEDLATYCGTHFVQLWADFNLIRK